LGVVGVVRLIEADIAGAAGREERPDVAARALDRFEIVNLDGELGGDVEDGRLGAMLNAERVAEGLQAERRSVVDKSSDAGSLAGAASMPGSAEWIDTGIAGSVSGSSARAFRNDPRPAAASRNSLEIFMQWLLNSSRRSAGRPNLSASLGGTIFPHRPTGQ